MEKVIAIIRKSSDTLDVKYQMDKISEFCRENEFDVNKYYTYEPINTRSKMDVDELIKFVQEESISRIIVVGISRLGCRVGYIKQTIKDLNNAGIRLTTAETGMTIYIDREREVYDEASLVVMNTLDEILTMELLNAEDSKMKIMAMKSYHVNKKDQKKS